jgi:aminodeoxyfutalosine deaminase
MIVYQADWVCPVSSAPIRNGTLAVENGRIVQVLSDPIPDGVERVVYPGCAILPGFVNAHAHLELTLFQGLLDDLSFPNWIAKLVRMKYQMCTRDALKVSAQLGAIEMLSAGITTVGEVMDVETGWEAMREFGLQGVAYQEVFGPAAETSAQALRSLNEKVKLHRQHETSTRRIGISPHAPYSVSKNLYEGVRDYARSEGLRMTAHIAESEDETLFVRDGAGAFAESHRQRNIDVVARGCLPVAYLDRLGLLGPDMLLVHAIETDKADLDRLRDTGSFVVHCPKSNAKLGHRIAPVAQMRQRGVPVALGTDSVASNDAFDMFEEMRAVVAQQYLPFDDVLRMATIEGAHALGLSDDLGSLEAAKRADFTIVALHDAATNPVEDILRSAHRSDVKATFVGGREVLIDDSEVRKEVQRVQAQLSSA